MGVFRNFPYSNFHEMNMDEILKILKTMQEEWNATKAEWASYKDFIDNYFANLDVGEEVLQALRTMASTGELNTVIDPTIATETASWLSEHITPTTPAVDSSLSIAGAAADAKVTGDKINELLNDINIDVRNTIYNDNELSFDSEIEFEQGQFTSTGEQENAYWIRTPLESLFDNNFIIYNPQGLRWSLAAYNSDNSFAYYVSLGNEPTDESRTIFTDKILKIDYLNSYKYRLRVARTTYVTLTPEQSFVRIFKPWLDSNLINKKSNYRKPDITLTNALIYHVPSGGTGTEGSIYNTQYYRTSQLFRIRKGETIRAYGAGAPTVWLMAEFSSSGVFIRGIKLGDGKYHIYEHTADHDEWIRMCGQIQYYSTGQYPVITENDLTDKTIVFYKNTYYSDNIKNSPLYGKTITGIGDSLMAGSITGNEATWLHRLALKYNMTEHNLGVNGNAFTMGYGTGTPISVRYDTIPESDIIIVEGGANDKDGNAPLGSVTDTENTTFAGALNTVITGIRTMYPKATILFLTDYNRYPSHYRAYADKMIEVCKYRSMPVFDNTADANVALTETSMATWQDEGMALHGVANLHLSPKCYEKELLPKYEAKLLELMGVSN